MAARRLKELMAEANGMVEIIAAEDAVKALGDAGVLFVDVREKHERDGGYIAGSIHAPRGFLEMITDVDSPMHNADLVCGKTLILYCGSGGRSALAGKTLADMGITDVRYMAGGLGAWKDAGATLKTG